MHEQYCQRELYFGFLDGTFPGSYPSTIRTYKREAPYRMLQSAQGLQDEAAFCILSFLFSAVLLPASYR